MKKIAFLLILVLGSYPALAQTPGLGTPPFGSFTNGGFDTINNQNLNAYFVISIASSTGRGMPLNLSLSYNALIWQPVTNGTTSWTPVTDAIGNPTWGWAKDFPGGQAAYTKTTPMIKCVATGHLMPRPQYRGFHYTDVLGTVHYFPSISFIDDSNCSGNIIGTTAAAASDASGYYMDGSPALNGNTPDVTSPGGIKNPGGTVTDTNGNFVTKTIVSSTETDWTDSVGNVALKIIYTPNATNPTEIDYKFLDSSGATQTIKLLFTAKNVKTNFACTTVTDYNVSGTLPSVNLPTELDIPTPAGGTLKYTFTYEQTPSNPTFTTGRLQKVTLPTLGSYEYDYPGANDSINCSDGTTTSVNRVVSDTATTATWNFVRNVSALTTTVTTPALADTSAANDTVYTFNSSGQETSRKTYANSPGSGTPLRTVNSTWASNGTPATQVTVLDDNSTQSETDTTFDSNGLLDSMTEYDWGTGAHGGALRTTTLSYVTDTNYTSRNIINLLSSKVIKDGTGTIQYRQDIAYDGPALTSCPTTGVLQHDGTNYPCTFKYRGEPTTVTTYLTPATPAGPVPKNFTYDWFGNLLTAQLNCCESKTWVYSSTTQYSQPDSVTSGVSQTLTTTYSYNLYLGLVTKSTDPNNLETDYTYDFLRRPTQVLQKNGSTTGETVGYGYDDANFKTTVTTTLDSTHSVKQIAAADKLGRTSTTTLEDASNNVYSIVQNEYNLAGRAYGTTNPYTTGSLYWTTTAFDALGRATRVTLPDTAHSDSSYTANTTTVTDPAGKQRKSVIDGAGRLSSVYEPDPSTGTLNVQTSYSYTVLDALMTVTEGSQTRSYTYDALGRLLSSTTPEGGLTCFGSKTGSACTTPNDGYDSFDNLLKRTDARGVLTSYLYDGLNRLTQVSYNVGTTGVPATPTVTLTYGLNSSCNSAHGAGCIGQLITMTDGVGSENYTFNSLEQETQLQKVIGSTTYNTSYAYNLAGQLTQLTYPSNKVVLNNLDAIGRLCSVGSSGSTCTTGPTYTTAYTYNAAQQLTGFNYANSVVASYGYSPDRLQLTSLSYAKSGTTLFGLTYSYGTAASNNGQIMGITDSVDNGRSVNYGYDKLARISTAVTTGSTGYSKWGLSWTYDRYGNPTNQTQTFGSPPHYNVTVAASTNQITGLGSYDANGNMTNDGYNNLVYDAENRAVSASNGSSAGAYTYDGNGLRVKKCVPNCTSPMTTTVYAFSGFKIIDEYDNGAAVGSPTREYYYSGSTLVAKLESGGGNYYQRDHLSNRLVTDNSGTIVEQLGHYPYGESWYNATNEKLLFTTYTRDAESGNDYAMARSYVNRLGRFSSLDLLAGSTSDPQSLNKYLYTRDEPIDFSDPSGLLYGLVCQDSDPSCAQPPPPPDPCPFASPVNPRACDRDPWPIVNPPQLPDPRGGGSIDNAKNVAQQILSGNNDCAKFFNSAPIVVISAYWQSQIPANFTTAAQFFQSDNVVYSGAAGGVTLPPTVFAGVKTGATGPGVTIYVQPNSGFDNERNAQGASAIVGPFKGGDLAGQAFLLLHELAHTLLAIPSDANNPDQSNKNNLLLTEKCYTSLAPYSKK